MFRLLFDTEIYTEVVQKRIPEARRFLWIGTADIKDMYIHKSGQMVPFLELLSDLIRKKVQIRLIHAKEPGPAFRRDFDKYPILLSGLERVLCPRVHFKTVIIDGRIAYSGSANLTGSGMGAKNDNNRNFENGFLTDDSVLVENLMNQFDRVWTGIYCKNCGRKQFCLDCPVNGVK